MSSLQDWERKMRERRRNTPFNTYLKEIVSWWPINLHRRDGVVSRYPRTERMPSVVTTEAFSDAVQARGELDYDFSSGFWDNYERLARGIPFPNVIHISSENCEFADIVGWSKNAYLSFIVMESQDVLYSYGVKDHSSDVVSSAVVKGSNNVYASSGVLSSSNIYYSRYIESSSDIWFCDNLVGCHECIFCSHLENASYRIGGEQLEREEYLRRKADLLSRKGEFDTWARRVDKHGRNTWSERVNGNMVTHSSDVENGLFVHDVQQGRNLVMVGGSGRFERCYDAYDSGTGSDSHDLYGLSGGGMGHDQYNCITSTGSYLYYCDFCWECSFCLGCVGLRGKSYCILNKQYSPDEWYALADRIFAVMETEGTLGAFFPGRANPFYFNDTMAYLMSPGFSREEILADSYLWRDHEISVDLPEGATATDIRDIDVTEYDESILDRIIRDGHGDCYRVVRMEYDFLRRHGLPLPREHWLRRIKRGFEFA